MPASQFVTPAAPPQKSPYRGRLQLLMGGIDTKQERDSNLTRFGRETLERSYMLDGETYQDVFARSAAFYADDPAHADRLYGYFSRNWAMPSTPILSNGGTTRGLPISCYLNSVDDSMEGLVDSWVENVWLARNGGGIGTYYGDVRSIGERVGHNGNTTGIIPFIKVQDSLTLAVSQGSLRRGSAAIYLPVSHPEIEEFLDMRRPTGGDPNRKALNLHHGVAVCDKFMQAVKSGGDFDLLSPKDKSVVRTVKARDLWQKILTTRVETGEPYMLFIDTVNRNRPPTLKALALAIKQSNLCVEITLPTGIDHLGKVRTAVCCLASVNIEKYDEWKSFAGLFVQDMLRFLDNVLSDFIATAPPAMANAIYAASRERSVGLGVMGFHSYLQSKSISFESEEAEAVNLEVHKLIHRHAHIANDALASERGACPDAAEAGIHARFSHMIAHAPTASISIICGTTSPSTEPALANAFLQKTKSGSFVVQNKHLRAVLESYGADNEATWIGIAANNGSAQHLSYLTEHEKAVFKTADEINQQRTVKMAADRQPYICQAQSLNIFVRPTITKRELHNLHMTAWESGLKSLYYCRSKSVQRAEVVSEQVKNYEDLAADLALDVDDRFETCASCQ